MNTVYVNCLPTLRGFLQQQAHPEWHPFLHRALQAMDEAYLSQVMQDSQILPALSHWFAAFSLPLSQTHYILLGESPYPRRVSANGYAFWDAAVGNLWTQTGLSAAVNRATSLRNLIKMLLFARGDLTTSFSQPAIAKLKKTNYIQTVQQLFVNLMQHGFLLLNATLVYSPGKVPYHARHWRPFLKTLAQDLHGNYPIRWILFGNHAKLLIQTFIDPSDVALIAEHPYNLSFIMNPEVVDFFKPFDLCQGKT